MEPTTTCPFADCNLTVDIILKSSDGILFGAHSVNLETYSSGFPPSSFCSASSSLKLEVVELPESSEVLIRLLQYMHHRRQPDSSKIEFRTLSGLAEAVEKYVVFSAMEVCRIRMKEAAEYHPLEVFKYSVKHGYFEICDQAVKGTISLPLEDVKQGFLDRPDILFAWIQYRECWMKIYLAAFRANDIPVPGLHPGGRKDCEKWKEFYRVVLNGLGDGLFRVEDILDYIELATPLISECSHCVTRAERWKDRIRKQIDAIPEFSSLL